MRLAPAFFGLAVASVLASSAFAQITQKESLLQGIQSIQVQVDRGGSVKGYYDFSDLKDAIEFRLQSQNINTPETSEAVLRVHLLSIEIGGLAYHRIHTSFKRLGLVRDLSGPKVDLHPAMVTLWETATYGTVGKNNVSVALTKTAHNQVQEFLKLYNRVNSGYKGEIVDTSRVRKVTPGDALIGLNQIFVVPILDDKLVKVFPITRMRSIVKSELEGAGIDTSITSLPRLFVRLNVLERDSDWAFSVSHGEDVRIVPGKVWQRVAVGSVRKSEPSRFATEVREMIREFVKQHKEANKGR
jgi:hypothetical protein